MRYQTTSLVQRWQASAVVMAFLTAVALLGIAPTAADASQQGVEVFIGFDRTPGASEQALVRAAGGDIRFSYDIVPAIAAVVPESALAGLERNPRIDYIEPVTLAHALDHPSGDAELDGGWGVAHIGTAAVHAAGNTGAGVRVAIIDTGISNSHPELTVAGGRNFLNNTDAWADDNGHGTHVAGTACAEANEWGVAGVAAGCDLYALKVLNSGGSGSWAGIVAAINWAVTNNIDVANLSLGSSGHPGTTAEQAFANAYDSGLLIVAAAGNSGNCAGNRNSVEYPGRFASVIAVAATNQGDTRPCFSSTGSAVELAAPGVSVLSTWDDSTSGTNPQPVQLCDSNGSDGCAYFKQASGTSMASPHVAGVAALVMAANPGMSNVAVRAALADSAINIGPSNHYGAGLVSASGAVGAEPPAPTTGSISGMVTDSTTGNPITEATVSVDSLSTTTDDDGAYVLDGVPAGDRTVSATADGYVGANQQASVTAGATTTANFALDPEGPEPPPPDESTVSVASIAYVGGGGPSSNRHLRVTVVLEDDNGAAVASASVQIRVTRASGGSWTVTGTTGTSGAVTFSFNNVGGGCYASEILSVSAAGLTWDGVTPTNGRCT